MSDVGSTCPVVDRGGYENQNICVADWEGDCDLDGGDATAFQTDFSNGDRRTDLDGNGMLDFNGVLIFLALFNAGCRGARSQDPDRLASAWPTPKL